MELNIDRSLWKKVKLGDVAYEYSERINDPSTSIHDKFVGSSNIGRWDFRITSFESTDSVTSAMKLFRENDYLLVRRSLYASDFRERAPRAQFSGVCSGDILTIRENPECIADGFLVGILNSPRLWKYVVANASGSITRRIKWRDLANYEFLLPPKDQQAELAELLWAMDEVIERERLVESRTQILLEANRRNLNRGELTEYTGGQLTSLITKGASPKWQGFDYCDEGTLFVTSENIREDSIDISNKKYLPLSFNQKQKRSQLEKGDILINIVGASIGRLAIFNEEIEHANINQAVCLFRVNSKALAEYLVQYILEESNKNRLLNNQSATARPNLSLKNLKDYKFYLPTIQIQKQRIVEITKVKTALKGIQNNISHATSLQKAIINQIF